MRPSQIHLGLLCAALLCAGCGTPGAPQPPSLRLPKPVADLQAIRKGDDVYLRWTVPTRTTDNSGIRPAGLGTTRICRGYVTEQPNTCRDIAADIATKADTAGTQTAIDHIADRVGGNRDFLSYTVTVNNDDNRGAVPSNVVLVFVAPSLAAPPALNAQLRAPKNVAISWEAHELPVSANLKAEYLYRVKRVTKDPDQKTPAETVLAELPATPGQMSFDDHAFAWEKTYDYRVAGVTRVISSDGKTLAEFEGKDSPAVTVVAHDIFPPPVPTGLQAVYSEIGARKAIDLTWSAEVDVDVAGYNVYRFENGQGYRIASKLNNGLVTSSAYRDENVESGKTYTYYVKAVDPRGNESKESERAREKVPE